MANERTLQPFDLSLPYAPNMVELTPPDAKAAGGASIAHVRAGFKVTSLAYLGQAENDLLSVFLNEENVNEVTIAEGEEAKDISLTIPPDFFQKGYNPVKFRVRRTSGNEVFSKELVLLYRSSPPGDTPPVLSITVSHKTIGAIDADSVTVTVAYKNIQWYDQVLVFCNGAPVKYQLLPDNGSPVGVPPQNIVIPIPRQTLEQGGDDSDFEFKFRVVDILSNPNGPPTWSDTVTADVHLSRLTLNKAILREIPTDNNDDPDTVDLAKLNGNPLSALIHLVATIWKAGDSIKLVFTAKLNDGVVATHEETLPITQVPSQILWTIPNNKIIANSTVKVIYQQIRGTVIATSEPATAQVVGVGVPPVPELIVDTSLLSLKGENCTLRYNWPYTGNDPVNTAANRAASGGVPPYIYESRDPKIASVDSKGVVRSEGNGRTTIWVRDYARQQKSFDVETANVTHCEYTPSGLTLAGARAYVSKVGGSMIPNSLTDRRLQVGAARVIGFGVAIGIIAPDNPRTQITIYRNVGTSISFGRSTLPADGSISYSYWIYRPAGLSDSSAFDDPPIIPIEEFQVE